MKSNSFVLDRKDIFIGLYDYMSFFLILYGNKHFLNKVLSLLTIECKPLLFKYSVDSLLFCKILKKNCSDLFANILNVTK